MRKRANELVDIALTEVDFGVAEGKYFIADNGVVKTASKKVKKTIKDTRGYDMVVVETTDGESVAIYIADLMTAAFGVEDQDMFNEKKLKEAKTRTASKAGKRSKFRITCKDTGEEFKSFASAAVASGINYDKFYNAFYTKKLKEAVIDGKTYTITSNKEVSEETSEEVTA